MVEAIQDKGLQQLDIFISKFLIYFLQIKRRDSILLSNVFTSYNEYFLPPP